MAAVSFTSSTISSPSHQNSKLQFPHQRTQSSPLQSVPIPTKSNIHLSIHNLSHLRQFKFLATRAKSGDLFEEIEAEETLLASDGKPVKFLLLVLLWASVSIGLYAFSGDAKAATTVAADSVRASGFRITASIGPKLTALGGHQFFYIGYVILARCLSKFCWRCIRWLSGPNYAIHPLY